jgi:hypothetical protein
MEALSALLGEPALMTTIVFQEPLDLFEPESSQAIFELHTNGQLQITPRLTFKPTPDVDSCVEDEYEFGRQITPFEQLPNPKEWVERFVHSAVEILNGKRSAVQLSRWCNRKVFTYLSDNARVRPAQVRIGRKSIGQPFDQILEVTAMLHGKERSRILVARFEGLDGRWLCVELFTI